MRVLLLAPLFENPKYPLYMPSENLGLGYLAAVLRHDGLDVDVVDANMAEILADSIPDHAPGGDYDVVGISVPFQSVVEESLRAARAAREAWPSAHITFGGHFPTFRHREILEHSVDVDSVVRGDGEDILSDLCRAIRTRSGLESVAGLTYRDSVGRVVANADAVPRADIDSLPWPSRDTLGFIRDLGHPWPTQVSSSRGCYASCAFCDIRSFYGRTWRARDPVKLIDEIEWLHRSFGSKTFRFTDDEFIGPRPGKGPHGPTRAREIAREVIRRGLHIELMIDSRAEAVDRELFAELRAAGTIDCLIGIESGVDRILKLYTKGATVEKNIRAIEILRELGISLNLGFIMFDPRMTMEDLKENYGFLRRMDIVTVDSLRSWLWPLFGTPVVQQLRTAGLVEIETLGDVVYRFADASVQRVYDIVTACATLARPFDRAVFQSRKDHPSGTINLESLLREYLALWTRIFESAFEENRQFEFAWVETELGHLLSRLSRVAASPNPLVGA